MAIQLAPILGISAVEIESEISEHDIEDYWKAYLKSKGIETRTQQEQWRDAGYSSDDMEKIRKEMNASR